MDNQVQPSKSREITLFLWETLKIVVIALIIIIPIRYFVAQPFFVKGASMEPSFEDGDYLVINEISYRLSEPKRGDVVVLRYPEDPSQFFIKRIIGLPEETIEIKDNQVIIYNQDNPLGVTLDESSYLANYQMTEPNSKIKLDADEYFVLGDNRIASLDSRRFGPVKETFLIGKTFLRAWPLSRFTLLK